ncbi:MAG: cell division FtsA domain-containing protein, partial [Lachnospiraceae bacterium]|nr:cell division FtsA domain-containing protein [Lachnospiraceae bacterium]
GTIQAVKERLEEKTGRKLENVCIAAAGRVLKTIQIHTDYEWDEEKTVTEEDIFTLHSMATEEAYKKFLNDNDSDVKFYCVGSSVVHYYLNDFAISNLKDHKAKKIGVDMIATFLPDDVVDGLYKAVEMAGLTVANLTLEPIAAIELAIPERFRLLNIALVDVGAGTSDISITKDGTIIAFGMILVAGDSLTEAVARHCMVDFNAAESIKRKAGDEETVTYEDIMGLTQTITAKELEEVLRQPVEEMTTLVADKIKELNGDKPVGAVFVVGGGGKIPGYTQALSKKLSIAPERVALRGKEVMQNIIFEDEEMEQNSLLVTPLGICLDFYKENNNFIYVNFNNENVKLYNNRKLTVMDAAMQTDFPTNGFFPKSGKELNFTVNGKKRIVRGESGEPAVITVNKLPANLHTPIKENDIISVKESTAGAPGKTEIGLLPEYKSSISVIVNGAKVELPKFASVNGQLQSEYYSVLDGDNIEFLDYYSVAQIEKFMDIELEPGSICMVNNKEADEDTKVYENFEVSFEISDRLPVTATEDNGITPDNISDDKKENEKNEEVTVEKPVGVHSIQILVNKMPVTMSGKEKYVFVDVFNYISFDLSKPQGVIVTTLNGRDAGYMEELKSGDVVEIYWRKPE